MRKPIKNKGASERQLKVGELIKRVLAEVFLEKLVCDEEYSDYSATISEVKVSPDLRNATAYVLQLGVNHDQEKFINFLNRNKHQFRKLATKSLCLKFSPEIIFRIDNSFDIATKIDYLIHKHTNNDQN
jgi:ribosome-binding factor A